MTIQEQTPQELSNVSRRTFIKMVIASGAAVSASAYLFRGPHAAGPGFAARRGGTADDAERQRPDAARGRDEAGNARDDAALQARPHRHEAGLRPIGVRRVHRPHRRCPALLVLDSDAHGSRQEDSDDRRARGARTARCIRCSRRSSTSRDSSARSACPDSSCRRSVSSRPIRTRRAQNWRTAFPATSAAAPTTTRFCAR